MDSEEMLTEFSAVKMEILFLIQSYLFINFSMECTKKETKIQLKVYYWNLE